MEIGRRFWQDRSDELDVVRHVGARELQGVHAQLQNQVRQGVNAIENEARQAPATVVVQEVVQIFLSRCEAGLELRSFFAIAFLFFTCDYRTKR